MSQRLQLLLATFSLSVLLYVDRVCISVAKDAIGRDLELSDIQMGWVLSAFALGYAIFQTPSGMLADRYGARLILAAVVVAWSAFTGLTAAAFNLATLLVIRFLFGAGEAGAFPGIARVTDAWYPVRQRGLVQGINFSGARLGAAFALPLMPLGIQSFGWRASFLVLMATGFLWAVAWYLWFRDDPAKSPRVSPEELQQILAGRQSSAAGGKPRPLPWSSLYRSTTIWLLCGQYFCSNFTFFFCLTWLHPHLKKTYSLTGLESGLYATVPFVCGAFGNWVSGWLVDSLFRQGRLVASRRAPAILGFVFSVAGVLGSAYSETALSSVIWLSLAVFGADMTLAPSWSLCIDIARGRSGTVSGTMNMAGNLGSFLTGLAFPYLAEWTGSHKPFFFVAAALSAAAAIAWTALDPRRVLASGDR